MKKTTTISLSSLFMVGAILFWGVPVGSGFLEEQQTLSLSKAFIEVIQPSFCAVSGFLYTRNERFTWYLPLGIMLLFLPVCFLYYSIDSIIWVVVYGACSLAGCAVALLVKRQTK